MIGGLQGDFGNLDIKYLKQNIPKDLQNVGRKYQEASGEHCSCATFCLQLGVIRVNAMEDLDMSAQGS